jgi:GNAT superfamily N-acetyltransferase
VLIRDRTPADGEALEGIARLTHVQDGYPKYLPADLRTFLLDARAIGAWVVEDGGVVLGHVALHADTAPEVMEMARLATGLEDDRLVVLARLLVAPSARRRGIGRALVERATAEAATLRCRAVLDVVKEHKDAICLYEECGWTRIGEVEWSLPDGRPLQEFVYASRV